MVLTSSEKESSRAASKDAHALIVGAGGVGGSRVVADHNSKDSLKDGVSSSKDVVAFSAKLE